MKSIKAIVEEATLDRKLFGGECVISEAKMLHLCTLAAKRGYEAGYHDCDRGPINPKSKSKLVRRIIHGEKKARK